MLGIIGAMDIEVAEIKNNKFNYSNGYRPKWITEFENKLKLG